MVRATKYLLPVIFFFFTFSASAAFEKTMDFQAQKLNLVGSYKLEYGIFGIDVYQVAYYKNKESSLVSIVYDRKITKKLSAKGWKKGLNKEKHAKQIEWLIEATPDMKKGDSFLIFKSKKPKTRLFRNNKEVAQSEDPLLYEIVQDPWIGDNPVDKKMKKALVGSN